MNKYKLFRFKRDGLFLERNDGTYIIFAKHYHNTKHRNGISLFLHRTYCVDHF